MEPPIYVYASDEEDDSEELDDSDESNDESLIEEAKQVLGDDDSFWDGYLEV